MIVQVTTEKTPRGAHEVQLWIVATGNRSAAETAVRHRVSAGSIVEATTHLVSEDTVKRLGLAPGQAWCL
jgi:hypothetical protein